MPTYQYRCTDCNDDLEIVQKFTDPTLTVCPSCEGSLRKVFNAVGVVFKGSGFYRTDSRAAAGGKGHDEGSAADSSSSSDSTAGKGTESSGSKSDGSGSSDSAGSAGDSSKSANGSSKTHKKESSTAGAGRSS